jgi:hypothetical protein
MLTQITIGFTDSSMGMRRVTGGQMEPSEGPSQRVTLEAAGSTPPLILAGAIFNQIESRTLTVIRAFAGMTTKVST